MFRQGGGFLDNIAHLLGGGGYGAQPDDQRNAAQLALLAAGIQTLSGAGSRDPLENISAGLATGVGTFQDTVGQNIERRQKAETLDLDRRSVELREEQFDFELDLFQDQKKRERRARNVSNRLWENRAALPEMIGGLQSGPLAGDEVVASFIKMGEQAAETQDKELFDLAVKGIYERIGMLTKDDDFMDRIRYVQGRGLVELSEGEGGVTAATVPGGAAALC